MNKENENIVLFNNRLGIKKIQITGYNVYTKLEGTDAWTDCFGNILPDSLDEYFETGDLGGKINEGDYIVIFEIDPYNKCAPRGLLVGKIKTIQKEDIDDEEYTVIILEENFSITQKSWMLYSNRKYFLRTETACIIKLKDEKEFNAMKKAVDDGWEIKDLASTWK
jgi:hypothetical protein